MAMATSSIPFSKLSLLGSWNALSASNHSAGNFAMDAGNQEAFDIILNSGIQAELIFGTIARSANENNNQL
ncbi:unnamed protein product [Linum tenue]|uniref:Uncharacterized protein n=1 Tax=Linum tenue TaxID=586396 RepID=A0AAV0MZU7_9ROSI|nr:unnamed protein product [Linum tenue]